MRKPSVTPSTIKAGLPSLAAFVGALVVATQDGSAITTNEWLVAALAALTAGGAVGGLDYRDRHEYEAVMAEEEEYYAAAIADQETYCDEVIHKDQEQYEVLLADREAAFADTLAEQEARYNAQYDAWAQGYDAGETFEDEDPRPAREPGADMEIPEGTDYA